MKFLIYLILIFISLSLQAKQAVIYSEVKLHELDPVMLKYVEEWEISGIIYESLVKPIGAENTIRPSLAENWEYADNELKFTLKKGLKFSDGSALSSKHVIESLKRYMLLEKSQSSVLQKCLSTKKKIKKISEEHPSLIISDERNFSLKVKNGCSNEIVRELGQPIYGIVQTERLDKDLQLPYPPVASGPFVYKVNNGDLTLNRNKKNWAWKNSTLKIDAVTFSNNENITFDAIRTNKVELYKKIKDKSYNVIYSLPNITWYLSYDCNKKEECLKKEKVARNLKASMQKEKISTLGLGIFDMAARSFFPASFNCPTEKLKIKNVSTDQCVSFEYGSRRKNDNALKVLRRRAKKLGYNTNNNCKDKQVFKVYAQFINDEIVPTIVFLATIAQTIPGIKSMKKFLPKSEEGIEYSKEKLCKEFSKLSYVPVFHTRTAFFYKMKEIEKIFFKSGGYLYFLDLPFVK